MKKSFTFIDLFAGIGGLRIPFEELGGKCVLSSEIDEYAQDTYEANFGERPKGDITRIPSEEIPEHNILLAGFPCQSFSIIGKGMGFADTRGTLFFEIERILRDKQPDAFLLENVKRLVSHDDNKTFKVILEKLSALGYYTHWKVLNALDYGLPQKRERIIIVGFKDNCPFFFPKPVKKRIPLTELIEDHSKVDKKYFASAKITKKRQEKVKEEIVPKPAIWHENKAGDIGIHDFSCAIRAGASYNYLLVDGIRRPTPRELLRLQGFPEQFKIAVSDQQIRKQAGNSVPVPMIREIAKQMIISMNAQPLSVGIITAEDQAQTILNVMTSNEK
ncbi:DNA cytosine methyltransferase [Candidatus Woesearchaeota archaeon]|nr:DNA cytosine methyltransferase [Candidatus Woesearchaeota archaeon]